MSRWPVVTLAAAVRVQLNRGPGGEVTRAAAKLTGQRRMGLALAVALALLAAGLGVTLSGSPEIVVRANSTAPEEAIAETYAAAAACQGGEVLPAGVTAIRLTLSSDSGPRVRVKAVSAAGHVLASGAVASGWTNGAVTVPVRPLARTARNVEICFSLGPTKEQVAIMGSPTSPAVAASSGEARLLPGRLRIEYLRAAHRSWWLLASSVARRMGLGRAPAGTWIVMPVLAAMAAALLGASWLILRELG